MGTTNISRSTELRDKVWQGTCEVANTIVKEVNVGEGFELYNGVKVRIFFKTGSTVTNGTLALNVNNTGAFDMVTVDGVPLSPAFIRSSVYLDFTYTETPWGSAAEPYNVWMLNNITTATPNVFGFVRVKDSPNAEWRAHDSYAASPKALQEVKDIADAAATPADIAIALEGYATKNYVDNAVNNVADGGKSGEYLPLTGGTMTGDIIINNLNSHHMGQIMILGQSGRDLVLSNSPSGASISMQSSNGSMAIWANSERHAITGLTSPQYPEDAVNKEYADSIRPAYYSLPNPYLKLILKDWVDAATNITLFDGNPNVAHGFENMDYVFNSDLYRQEYLQFVPTQLLCWLSEPLEISATRYIEATLNFSEPYFKPEEFPDYFKVSGGAVCDNSGDPNVPVTRGYFNIVGEMCYIGGSLPYFTFHISPAELMTISTTAKKTLGQNFTLSLF